MSYKKRVNQVGLGTKKHSLMNLSGDAGIKQKGIAGNDIIEPVPNFITTQSEKVISSKNNAWIVLGRDRPGSRLSGYGGRGDTQCASIDIVAGRMGSAAISRVGKDESVWVDPNATLDAARVYISQKTDVDDNFALAKGNVGVAKTRSAVALKADGIRLIAREGIKLVTGLDPTNSQGGDNDVIHGIDLIAGNDDSDMQPLAKGTNLSEAIARLAHHLDRLNGIVDSFLHTQMSYNEAIAQHWHNSPFFGSPTTISFVLNAKGVETAISQLEKVEMSLFNHKQNVANFRHRFMNPASEEYILSRHNNTN